MMRDEKGQSLLEFALILPVLILFIVGIYDFGRVFYSYMHLHIATQETVRLGGLGKSDSEIIQFARNYIKIGDSSLLDVQVSPSDAIRKSGDYVTVTFNYPFESITPILSELVPSPFILSTDSTIRVE